VGGSCSLSCATGYKACGTACISSTLCCTNADCPNDPANHRQGLCGVGGQCGYTCDTGYKACGTTCIATSACCSNADCVTPPSGCYKSAGACSAGTCTYPYNDGAACNADNNACTPNDSCMSGTCIADTAHQVVCVQRACHSAPSCNTTTGDCTDTALTDGTACGGNGCTAAGTCTGGNCSSPTKDCSSLNTACKLGICDPSLPASSDCTTQNQVNGTACTLTDLCQLQVACSGGTCIGTPKVCPSLGTCHIDACNSATGNCDDTLAAAGTSCATSGSCIQNATCDANGNCNGDSVPDGTACEKSNCSEAAECVSGMCTCVDTPDLSGGIAPVIQTDGGVTTQRAVKGKGCEMSPHGDPRSIVGVLLCLLAYFSSRRRRVRASR
jgi:hypothetical protein